MFGNERGEKIFLKPFDLTKKRKEISRRKFPVLVLRLSPDKKFILDGGPEGSLFVTASDKRKVSVVGSATSRQSFTFKTGDAPNSTPASKIPKETQFGMSPSQFSEKSFTLAGSTQQKT